MAKIQRLPLDRPLETIDIPLGTIRTFEIGGHDVSWQSLEPGWRWSESIKPIAGTEYCEFHHMGFTLSGRGRVEHRDGAVVDLEPGQFFEIPPYHDAWVVGDEPWTAIDWGENVGFGQALGMGAERRVATLLFTDIVESTATARRLGDARWRNRLYDHNRIVRSLLGRFRGRELTTTGDGFLAVFDSAERAVRAGLAIAKATPSIDLQVRCGVHTGEVDLEADNARGLAVHIAARVVAFARPGEVYVSWTTADLLAGTELNFEERGRHELKGVGAPRPIYAVLT